MDSKIYRVNIRVSEKVKRYFETKSKETTVSQSALMALALDEYIDQKALIEFTKKVNKVNVADYWLLKVLKGVK